jgi:hypothetical protein
VPATIRPARSHGRSAARNRDSSSIQEAKPAGEISPLDAPRAGRWLLGWKVHGGSSVDAWARARAIARALRTGQQATVSTVMAAKLHQKGAVSP